MLLELAAGKRSDGTQVMEEVLVEELGPGRYRLSKSPGLVLGLAAGDVFSRSTDGAFSIIERAGNVCVQIFLPPGDGEPIASSAAHEARKLGGWLDGKHAKLIVLTVPLRAGFKEIEGFLETLVQRFPGAEWYYGNVYDAVDGVTPLNWWVH